MDVALQGGVDVLPVKGVPAKVLGVARISGTDVVLALRDDTCHAVFLPSGATGPAAAAPAPASTSTSIGAQRPAVGPGCREVAVGREAGAGHRLAGRLTVQPAQSDGVDLGVEQAAHPAGCGGEAGEHRSDARRPLEHPAHPRGRRGELH
ncbi:hypothetical protein ACFV0O_02025 [Kitasatospora sp. NPDC059577]|uniref:hypothetical protein n=1 Tax=Kitasatospora sp. NPDC059577 TaxID=3346873 RepID=UPI0036A725AC